MCNLLVVDFDGTFQLTDDNSVDCVSAAYLVETADCEKAEMLAQLAKTAWVSLDNDKTLLECIEEVWRSKLVQFKYVGALDIRDERQSDLILDVSRVHV